VIYEFKLIRNKSILNKDILKNILKISFSEIGFVREDNLFVVYGVSGKEIIRENIANLKEAWKKTLNSVIL